MRDGQKLHVAGRELGVEVGLIEQPVLGHFDVVDLCAGGLADELPGDDVAVVLHQR